MPALDEQRLADLGEDLGDDDFLQETVSIYLAELPGRRSVMRQAFLIGDREQLRDSAHSLGSASALLGACDLEAACRAVERQALSVDAAGLAALAQTWSRSCELAEPAL